MKHRKLLFLISLVFLFTACGTVISTTTGSGFPTSTPLPTDLHVIRAAIGNYAPLQKTVQDTATIQQLYQMAYSLPVAPSGVMNCPMDNGLVYQLDFSQGSSHQQNMTLQASGCQFLFLGPGQTNARRSNEKFNALLSQALGIPSLVPTLFH